MFVTQAEAEALSVRPPPPHQSRTRSKFLVEPPILVDRQTSVLLADFIHRWLACKILFKPACPEFYYLTQVKISISANLIKMIKLALSFAFHLESYWNLIE
jgi:hypothetical protein